jgi:hypothetical protein
MKFTVELFSEFLKTQDDQGTISTNSLSFSSILGNSSSKVITTNDLIEINRIFDMVSEESKILFTGCLNEMEMNSPLVFYNLKDFTLFNQIFAIFLEFSKYDINSLRRLFILSHLFSLSLSLPGADTINSTTQSNQSSFLTTKASIRNHLVWQNLPFWIDVTKLILSEDIANYENIIIAMSKHNRLNLMSHYYNLSLDQFLFFFIMTRIDAIIHSMKYCLCWKLN